MKAKFLILYTWFVRTVTYFLPDVPLFQSFRGWLYSFGMKKCGSRFRVCHNVVLNRLEKMEIGKNVYFAPGAVVTGGGRISIGDNVLIGPNVVLAADNHRFDGESFANGYIFGEVVIERNSWIGGNATLLMGTRIPPSCIVGAGAVCNEAFEIPFSLYAGVPAKYVKDIRSENSLKPAI
jgi:acetyltransferase-like isoleucine patch superfamily enzyme